MTDYTLRLVVDGDASGATSALQSATSALNSFGGNAMKAGGILSAGLTLPLVAIGKAALDAGTKLNAGMANIGSMGIAIGRVNELKKSIQEVSIQTGKTTDDLAKGTYQIISAYGDSASTAKILEVNTKVAAAGVASLSDTVGAISIVTKNWGDTSVEAQQHVGDLLLKTVALGQTTLPELASNLGNVAPAAHAAGISTQEMFAAIATAAGVSGNTSAAITQLNSVFAALGKPTEDLTKLLKANGFASGQAALQHLGLEGTLKLIYNQSVKAGVPLADFTKRQEAGRLVTVLATTSAKTYAENLAALGKVAGTTDMAFDAQTNGVNKAGFAMEVAKAKMEVFLQKINDGMGPAILAFTDLVGPLVDKLMGLADTFTALDPGTQKWIVGIAAGAAAIGPLLLGVGSLAKAIAFFLPFASGLATALIPATIGLGLLYGAYKLNAFGLRDLVDTGFKRIQAAAPLAGDALKSVWKQFTGSREDIGKSTLAIYDFVSTLTGSDAAGLAAVNWVTGLATKVQAVKTAFASAGGGVNGFISALSSVTGGKFTIDASGTIAQVKWGDFVGTLDWGKYIFTVKWGDFIGVLGWNEKVLVLKWGDFVGKFDWGNLVVTLRWGDYVVKLSWADLVTKFSGWGDYIEHLTWKSFVADLTSWTPYVAALTWSSFVSTFEWSVYANKLVWSEYIAPLSWGSVIGVFDWSTATNKLVWGEFVHQLTWSNVSTFQWSEFISKLDWVQYVTPVGWLTYIAKLSWDNYLSKMSWGELVSKLEWTQYLTPVGWGTYITGLVWDKFVGGKLTWSSFIESFSWTDFIEKVVWSAFLPSLTWASFVTGVDLRSYIPSFPGWAAIASALGFSAPSAPAGPPASAAPSAPSPSGGSQDFLNGLVGASGWDNWRGGKILIGEAGREVIQTPDGKWAMANGPTITNLPSGTKIYKNADTEAMMKGGLSPLRNYAGGNYNVPYSPTPYNGPYAPQPFVNNPFGTQAGPTFDTLLLPLTRLTENAVPALKAIVTNTANTHRTLVSTAVKAAQSGGTIWKTDPKLVIEMTKIGANSTKSYLEMQKEGMAFAKSFKGTAEEFKSFLQKVPGLFGASSVTSEDMAAAKAGTYQPKADEKLRQLKDLAEHGVKYAGLNVQDFKDALGRIGVKASDDLKTLTAQVTAAWNDQSLFADKKNISSLLDIKAIKASITQQKLQADQSAAGNANLMALFGITPEATKATGKKARQDLQAGLMDASIVGSGATGTGAAGGGSNIVSSLLGNATVTPESVAPFAQSFMAALGKAMTPTKDKNGKSTGLDFGALLSAAMDASIATTTAFDATGTAILAKITGSFKDVKGVDFIGGIVGAMNTNLADNSAIKALNNVGQKIGSILKEGIADFFKSVDLASAVANGAKPAQTAPVTKLPGNASGTSFWRGGYTRMDERGGEIVDLPRGSRVYPHDVSQQMAAAAAGGPLLYMPVTVTNPIDYEKIAYRVMQTLQKRGRG